MDNHKDTTRHHTTDNHSISDTDDEFHSPLRPDELPSSPSRAIVAVNNYYTSSFRSPTTNHQNPPQTFNLPPPPIVYNRSAREEPVSGVTNVNPGGGGEGGERRSGTATVPATKRRRKVTVDQVVLGFRVLEIVFSITAFAVMASDKTEGWSGDSFDRYKEYRYVVAVNAMAFAYAAFQAIDMSYLLKYEKHITSYSLRTLFDFLIDQIFAYLLISASSSAATRVDDWVSNWGKDDFTEKASASIGMSFLAFITFALSSIISGYNLCNHNSL